MLPLKHSIWWGKKVPENVDICYLKLFENTDNFIMYSTHSDILVSV